MANDDLRTSSLELAPVELYKLAEDLLLVFFRETHSCVDHLHAEYPHCIDAELETNQYCDSCSRID